MKRIIVLLALLPFIFTACDSPALLVDEALLEIETYQDTPTTRTDHPPHVCREDRPGDFKCGICGKSIPFMPPKYDDNPGTLPAIPVPSVPWWQDQLYDFFAYNGIGNPIGNVIFGDSGGRKVLMWRPLMDWTLIEDPDIVSPSEDIGISLFELTIVGQEDPNKITQYPPISGGEGGILQLLVECDPGDTYDIMWYEIYGYAYLEDTLFWVSKKFSVERIP